MSRKPPMLPTLRARLRAIRDAAVAALKVTGGAPVTANPVDTAEIDAGWPLVDGYTNPIYVLMLVTWKLQSGKAVASTKELRAEVRDILDAAKLSEVRLGGVTFRISDDRVSIYGDKVRVTRCLRIEYVHATKGTATGLPKKRGINMERVMALLTTDPHSAGSSRDPLFKAGPVRVDPRLLN